MNTSSVVLTSVIVTAASSVWANVKEHKPGKVPRIILGAFGVGLVLTVVSTASAKVGTALAWLVMLGAVLVNGGRIVGASK